MQLLVVAFALIPLASAIPFLGTEQAVAVKGKLLCNGKPANNVKVKLYESEIGGFYSFWFYSDFSKLDRRTNSTSFWEREREDDMIFSSQHDALFFCRCSFTDRLKKSDFNSMKDFSSRQIAKRKILRQRGPIRNGWAQGRGIKYDL